MTDQIQNTIDVLAAKVRTKEEETNKLKKLINELCVEEGIPERYPNLSVGSGSGDQSFRKDKFYGMTLTSAARSFLEMRKSANLGAASVAEIYQAMRDGGYKFETKDEENAKIGLRAVLRKSSSIFHRLPTGDYGLLSWYPNAKAQKAATKDNADAPVRGTSKTKEKKPKTASEGDKTSDGNFTGNDQVRDMIFKMDGNFTNADVEKKLKEAFPSKAVRDGQIGTEIFKLKKKGFIRIVAERRGSVGATYTRS